MASVVAKKLVGNNSTSCSYYKMNDNECMLGLFKAATIGSALEK
jgi:hypothetical protein